MKNIFVIGAGRSATDLIHYLLDAAHTYDWQVVVGDFSQDLAQQKVGDHPRGTAIHFDATDPVLLADQVSRADLVVSFLPHHMHQEVALECIRQRSHLVTASYVSPALRELDQQVADKGLIFLGEMGADPGIDHMGAMKNIDEIRNKGGKLLAYKSYCGALVAPESNDNPWGYKFTWNPMNIVIAGQGTAQFIENDKLHYIPYHRLFSSTEEVKIPQYGTFEAYANRDSLAYRTAYGLDNIPTLYRATLRLPGFCPGWDAFVKLGLTDNSYQIPQTDQLTYREWIAAYLPPNGNDLSLESRLAQYLNISEDGEDMKRLKWTGLLSDRKISRTTASPAELLLDLLEEKLEFQADDVDMLVMYDHFRYEYEGNICERNSYMVTKGLDPLHTAISRTVGLPAAIGVKLILQDQIKARGVMIPTIPEIYNPVLEELESFGIQFTEQDTCPVE